VKGQGFFPYETAGAGNVAKRRYASARSVRGARVHGRLHFPTRRPSGKTIGKFQNKKNRSSKLAELKTEAVNSGRCPRVSELFHRNANSMTPGPAIAKMCVRTCTASGRDNACSSSEAGATVGNPIAVAAYAMPRIVKILPWFYRNHEYIIGLPVLPTSAARRMAVPRPRAGRIVVEEILELPSRSGGGAGRQSH